MKLQNRYYAPTEKARFPPCFAGASLKLGNEERDYAAAQSFPPCFAGASLKLPIGPRQPPP